MAVATYPSFAEAAAERPDGWRTDAIVDKYDTESGAVLAYRYFNVPPEKLDVEVAFEAKHDRPMEDMERFLIAMAVTGDLN